MLAQTVIHVDQALALSKSVAALLLADARAVCSVQVNFAFSSVGRDLSLTKVASCNEWGSVSSQTLQGSASPA